MMCDGCVLLLSVRFICVRGCMCIACRSENWRWKKELAETMTSSPVPCVLQHNAACSVGKATCLISSYAADLSAQLMLVFPPTEARRQPSTSAVQ